MPNPFGPLQRPAMHGLGKAPRAGVRKSPGLPPLFLLGAYGSPPLSANPINIVFGLNADNKVLYGGQWSNFDATFPVKLGDWLEITGTNNGNDGMYGPIIAFEKQGPFEWDTAVFDANFPNPDQTTTPAVVHVWTPDTEDTFLFNHDVDIALSGDPNAFIDTLNPLETWASLGVFPGDTIRLIETAPFLPNGSDINGGSNNGLYRVAAVNGVNGIQLWPVGITPATQSDAGTVDVRRIN